MTDFFRKMVKDLNDENTTIAEDGLSSSQFSGCLLYTSPSPRDS